METSNLLILREPISKNYLYNSLICHISSRRDYQTSWYGHKSRTNRCGYFTPAHNRRCANDVSCRVWHLPTGDCNGKRHALGVALIPFSLSSMRLMLSAPLAFTATPGGERRGYFVPEKLQALRGCLKGGSRQGRDTISTLSFYIIYYFIHFLFVG